MPFAKPLLGVAVAVALGVGISVAPAAAGGAVPASLAAPSLRSAIAGDTFAFVMTDRYRDGDPSNNTGGVTGALDQTGYDPSSISYFHGGDLVGLTGGCNVDDPNDDGLARLSRLGFTAIWITPPFVNRTVQGSSAGYHGYWFLDIAKPDPHLGTEAQFASFMGCAKRLGMKVFLDVVVNHTADTISFRDSNYSYIPIEQRPYRTAAGKAFNPWNYTKGTAFPRLKAANSFAHVPVAQAGFTKEPAILNDLTRYHNRGDIDWGGCTGRCEMDGDFSGLDDLMTEDSAVVSALADAYGAWITKYGIDGFRIDTAKHVDPYFFGRWLPLIQRTATAAGKPGFTSFGEVWLSDSAQLADQLLGRKLQSVLDFPFQDTMRKYVSAKASGGSLAALFDSDDYYTSAGTNAYGLTTFLGNHDMGRIGFFVEKDNPSLKDSVLARDLLAHDLLYLTRGVPVVYYGDEVGMTGSGDGTDKQARQDMFPTKVSEWQRESRIGGGPIGTGSSFAESNPIEARIAELAAARKAYPALAQGAQITRYGNGPVFVASRIDPTDRREYLVGFNASAAPVQVTVPTSTPSSAWRGLLGSADASTDGAGRTQITIPSYGMVALRASAQLPDAGTTSITLKASKDVAFGAYRVTASVPGTDPSSVTFVMRRPGGAWTSLGTDDARPFRTYLSPDRLGKGAKVEVGAIVTTTSGVRATSSTLPVKLALLF